MSTLISAERWKAIEPLIDRALDIDPEQRRAFFETMCGGDETLRRELEALVAECERPDATFETSLPERFPTLFEIAPLPPLAALGKQFCVERELGRGGMATVYLARDLRHDRDVAIKVLHRELAAVLGAERFLSEIRVTASLRHPHILPIFDSGNADGTIYYVMPYVAGESLRERLRRELQLPVHEALQVVREVGDALAYAHRAGVVHRDVKPENILLADGRAFVLDFGIALARRADAERLTQSGLAVGTPQYMSPEQASGLHAVDARTDVYSLGAVLYEMLAGEVPFSGPTPQAIMAKMTSGEVPSVCRTRPSVPPRVDAVIRKALASMPADRFAGVSELTAALDGAEMWASVPPTRSRARSRGLVAALAILIVVTFGVSAAFALRSRWRDPPLVPGRVLVVPFENETGARELNTLGGAAVDNLTRDLVNSHLADVVDARDVGAIPTGASGEAIRRLARRRGAARVLRGRYYAQGDSLRIEPQIVDSRDGRLLAPVQPVLVRVGDPSGIAEALRQRVLAAFAVLDDTTFDAWTITGRPARYDAYLEYVAGRSGEGVARRMQHLARAYALDTMFTLPLRRLAALGGCRVTDSIVDRLGSRLALLPVLERASLKLTRANCRGERDLALSAAREIYAAAPKSDWAAVLFANVARKTNHFRDAIAAMDNLDQERHRDDRTYWGNRIIPYHLLGLYDRELAAARDARRAAPSAWEYMAFQARAFAALGRLDELRPLLDSMEMVPANTSDVGSAPEFMLQIGRELHAHGYDAEARRTSERALAWLRAHESADPYVYGQMAWALYDCRRLDEAAALVQKIVRRGMAVPNATFTQIPEFPGLEFRSLAGAIAARRGDRGGVEATDRWLAGLSGPYLHGDNTFERARLAAILGDRERANALLQRAIDEGFAVTFGVGPHNDPDFDAIHDMPAYRSLYRDRS